ncbi:uncharacterized protein [Argopecten irradians]|uniref:uncharacterized protein n=1 Tax=Argopecten irradians TaxID=31199 RepID=UPI0037203321
MITLLVIIISVSHSYSNAVYDPCVYHVSLHQGKYRGTECEYKPGKAINDRYITNNLWYKVEGYSGPLSMATHPVDLTRCSTKLPIWMNGTHPSVGETVNRTACMRGLQSDCADTYNIQVKNCSSFNVYKLQTTRGLEMAYCFGEGERCPPTDPCESIDRDELKGDKYRSTTCSRKDLCDDSISGWYKVSKPGKDNTGLKMFDQCPVPGSCGAESPIWLSDAHPSPDDGIVTRDACVRNEKDCCGERFQIKVVNCKSYYVYELKARPTCPERYCFGDADIDITFGRNNGFRLQSSNMFVQLVYLVLLVWTQ